MKKETKVAESRNYAVKDVRSAKSIAKELLKEYELEKTIIFGLPEIDDRFHIWRVPLLNKSVPKLVVPPFKIINVLSFCAHSW